VLAVGELEVVVEAVADRGADRVLGSGETVAHGLRHQARGVADSHLRTPSESGVMIATRESCLDGEVEVVPLVGNIVEGDVAG